MRPPIDLDGLRELVLDRVRVGLREEMSAELELRLDVERIADVFGDRLVWRLTTELLEYRLPPATMRRTVFVEGGHWRWLTPLDHFRARYVGRWWARLLGPARAEWIDTSTSREVVLDIRQSWTFPEARVVFPAELGTVRFMTWSNWRDPLL